MSIYAIVSHPSPTRLWGLDSEQRLQRQLAEVIQLSDQQHIIHWVQSPADAPTDAQVLVINGRYLFESCTLSGLLARPDWGFIAVVFWSAATTIVLILRLLQAVLARLQTGPLTSWLSAPDVAIGPNANAYQLFGATRAAYDQR